MDQQYVSKADLAKRWGVSAQSINNWEKRYPGFPPEAFRVGNGRIPVYEMADVLEYEKRRNLNVKE